MWCLPSSHWLLVPCHLWCVHSLQYWLLFLLNYGVLTGLIVLCLQMFPSHYREARTSIWQQLQSGGGKLQPQSPQLPHMAFALLEQAAAAGLWDAASLSSGVEGPSKGWLPASCLLVASQALARVAADGDEIVAPGSALSEADLAAYFNVTVDDVVLGVKNIRDRCMAASSGPITSAYNLLEIYLEVLLAGQLARKVRSTCCFASCGYSMSKSASYIAHRGLMCWRAGSVHNYGTIVLAQDVTLGFEPLAFVC